MEPLEMPDMFENVRKNLGFFIFFSLVVSLVRGSPEYFSKEGVRRKIPAVEE
jgi:hypothetical protein